MVFTAFQGDPGSATFFGDVKSAEASLKSGSRQIWMVHSEAISRGVGPNGSFCFFYGLHVS